jgi:A/G-specific adenine glycosylase
MHSAARQLVEFNGGQMPDSYEGLLGMKGVGTYTAAAVASICFGEAKAVVDGNVARVIARIYGMEEAINSSAGKKTLESLADQLLSDNTGYSPGTHNQAMMEFGALHCLPRSPLCGDCPLKNGCNARLSNRVETLPLKNKKKKPLPRWMYFYAFTGKGETILSRREEQGIWRSLYHFPALESPVEIPREELLGKKLKQVLTEVGSLAGHGSLAEEASPEAYAHISGVSEIIKHQLSHLTIYARFIHVELEDLPFSINDNFHRISLDKLDQYAIPRLMERYMEVAKF